MPGSESIVARHREGEGAVVASNLLHRDGNGECIQTGAAVLEGIPGVGVPVIRSSVVTSQIDLHERFGASDGLQLSLNAEFSECPDSVHWQLLRVVPGTGVRLDLHFAERA